MRRRLALWTVSGETSRPAERRRPPAGCLGDGGRDGCGRHERAPGPWRLADRRQQAEQRTGRAGGAGPGCILALVVVAVGAFLALGSRPAEVVVAAARSAGGRAAALLNASGYVTPRRRATVAAKITAGCRRCWSTRGWS